MLSLAIQHGANRGSGWAFAQLGLARLGAQVELDNLASRRLLERCGFRHEGTLREYAARRDGSRADCAIYGLLVTEL
jgi:[ribosomal protein S5]-alanine N-acetyltransferase